MAAARKHLAKTSTAIAPSARPLLTTRDVAALLRVHPKHVYRLMRRDLPALRVGDEWRFNPEDVLRWAERAGARTAPAGDASAAFLPGLVAANGDLVIEALLKVTGRSETTLLGLVLADHVRARALLGHGRVLAAGSHAGIGDGEDGGPADDQVMRKTMRLQLVTREIGLAYQGRRIRALVGVVGKRFATRPSTAGIRRRFDHALVNAGVSPSAAYAKAAEYECHRDVALAVARGEAEIGLTTHAWAHAAGLSFLPVVEEDYDLCFRADSVTDSRIVALCETAQSGRFRRLLRECAGYALLRTGRLRAG